MLLQCNTIEPRSLMLTVYSPSVRNVNYQEYFVHSPHGSVFNVSDYLKPIAEEERRVEEAEKKIREEQERIYKQLSEGNARPGLHKHTLNSTRQHILHFGIVTFPQTSYVLCFLSLQQTQTLSSNEPVPAQSLNVPNVKQ